MVTLNHREGEFWSVDYNVLGEALWYLSPFVGLAPGSINYFCSRIFLSTQALTLAQPSFFVCSVQRAMIPAADLG